MNGSGGNNLTSERVGKFKIVADVMKNSEGKVFILFTQPDPDAIASAYLLQKILLYLGLDSQIIYSGRTSHPQNILVINTFDLSRIMTPITEVTIGEDDHLILVDSHSVKDSRLSKNLGDKKAEIIIDHHRLEGRLPEEYPEQFYWIEDCGACATLIYLLAKELDVILDKVALVLIALGIYTDTKNLLGASPRDLEVYTRVVSLEGVRDQFVDLAKYSLSPSFYAQLGYVLSDDPVHRWREGSKVLCSAGIIPKEDGDHLAIIADLFLREDGVSLVVVYGIVQDKEDGCFVRVSARSSNLGLQLDRFLAKAFEQFGLNVSGAKVTPDGRSEGGAHLCLNLGPWIQSYSLVHIKNMVAEVMRNLVLPKEQDNEKED